MATLTVQTAVLAGVTPSYAACAGGGDDFLNTGREMVHIKNGSGGALVVTFVTPKTYQGVALADPTVSVGAGSEEMIGPFPPGIFNGAAALLSMTYSGVTSLTIAVIKLP